MGKIIPALFVYLAANQKAGRHGGIAANCRRLPLAMTAGQAVAGAGYAANVAAAAGAKEQEEEQGKGEDEEKF